MSVAISSVCKVHMCYKSYIACVMCTPVGPRPHPHPKGDRACSKNTLDVFRNYRSDCSTLDSTTVSSFTVRGSCNKNTLDVFRNYGSDCSTLDSTTVSSFTVRGLQDSIHTLCKISYNSLSTSLALGLIFLECTRSN